MTGYPTSLSEFRAAYLEFLDGDRAEPPAIGGLPETQRRTAEAFVESIEAARGIDPYASRPSIEQLLAAGAHTATRVAAIGESLQAHLQLNADPTAVVVVDVAAEASGLDSDLVIHARGMRMRAILERSSTDLDDAFTNRVSAIAAVFGSFPDTNAVLYATLALQPEGVVVDRSDIQDAIETPSGASRPPRLRQPPADIATACSAWLMNAIPEFEPFSAQPLESTAWLVSSLDPSQLAAKAVAEVSTAGARARIEAKRAAWSTLGEPETHQLAAILDEAEQGAMSEDVYRQRLERIVGAAA